MGTIGSLFQVVGAGALVLCLNWRLGLTAMLPAIGVLAITRAVAPWVRRASRSSLENLGALSGDISEALANFRVIAAFNRADYLREKFAGANARNYRAAVQAGIASGVFMPLYTLAGNLALILVLGTGVTLIGRHELTIGLLIGYLLYVAAFYNPLSRLATVSSSVQVAMAALDRIREVLGLTSDLVQISDVTDTTSDALLTFEDVSFSYPGGERVLEGVSFALERGRTYALIGPTGGGKTTAAMLMARLYDPTHGKVCLDGREIRSLTDGERASKIGVILQEPVLLVGTVRDNIVYGHAELEALADAALAARLASHGLEGFLSRFPGGLATPVSSGGDGLSLGQKQLVAFLRAVLREPKVLILDEATANIDTVTEKLLEQMLDRLPAVTTKVIIAHRLNTIRKADRIFFVGGRRITDAGSLAQAVNLLLTVERIS
jgi:ATP-binding cassette subfamily B protein